MTVKELKDLLENYDENISVVVATEDNEIAVDILLKKININFIGPYRGNRKQMSYSIEYNLGEEALLVTL
jgi:hypothetical protein